jgi:hypothetical protein
VQSPIPIVSSAIATLTAWNIRSLVCRDSTREEWHPFILDCFGFAVSMLSWVASGTMAGVSRAGAISARQAFL